MNGRLAFRPVNKSVKTLLIAVIAFTTASFCWGDDIPQEAVNYYANKYGHEHPDTLQVVQIDFKGGGSRQLLMTFAKRDWSGPEAVWAVIEFKNGQWVEPKTLDIDGDIKDFSALQFDPADASFVYLPSYKHYGLLAHWRKNWTFTYLENDVLNTVYFWTAPEVGLTEQSLKNLMDANKITLQQRTIP